MTEGTVSLATNRCNIEPKIFFCTHGNYNRGPACFSKIDVQGGDLQALEGARNTINKFRMPILFEYEYLFEKELNLSFQEYVDFVKSIDYVFARVINGQNYRILPKE